MGSSGETQPYKNIFSPDSETLQDNQGDTHMTNWHRVGLLVPSSDIVMEADLWRRLPSHLTMHVARMYLESTTVPGEERMLDEELAPAAHRVASIHPELVIFGCTSAAALRGLDGDAAIAQVVEAVVHCPCVTVMQAAFDQFRRLAPRRLLLVTPYIQPINERMRGTFLAAGLPVTRVAGMGLDSDLEIGAVSPEEIHRFVVATTRETTPAPDCIFVSCTTFRAFEAAERLEQELEIPVVTSNRSVFKALLRRFGDK